MRGIVTIATGPPKYRAWAAALGRSLVRHYPRGHYHLITDKPIDGMDRYFSSVVQVEDGLTGLAIKLRLDEYSPYHETLFVDADSLVMRPLDFAFERFSDCSFSLLGDVRTSGDWYGNIESLLKTIGCEWLPKFNSGLIFFRKDKLAKRVFQIAREVAEQYEALGLSDPYGRVNDEPCFAIAMARCGIRPLGDDGTVMRTPIGSTGPFRCDPVVGTCQINSQGAIVNPAVIHFVSLTGHRSYTACRIKLWMAERGLSVNPVVNAVADLLAVGWAALRKIGFIQR